MRGSRSGRFAVAACALAGLALAPATAPGAARLKDCSVVPLIDQRCGILAVPLDRSGAVPGEIPLHVVVNEPARGRPTGTLLVLVGGPGEAATPALDFVEHPFAAATRQWRIVAFDQRGTGESAPLTCPSFGPKEPDDLQQAVAQCAQHLGPARAHYATADSVADIEAVRAALGVQRMAVFGTSYGTKVALDYASAYPQHVSHLVLDSVVPPEGIDPFERVTLASIPRVLRTICGRGGCPWGSDPAADLARLLERLRDGPLHGRVVGPRGHVHRLSITANDVLDLLLVSDADPILPPMLPAALRAGADGDAAPLLRMALTAGLDSDDGGGVNDAVYVATMCEDGGVPWSPGTPVEGRASALEQALAAIPAVELAPFDAEILRARGLVDVCRSWPESPIVQPRMPLPAVPTIIISGDQDLRTPRANALALAARMGSATVIRVPHTGHAALGVGDGEGCLSDRVAAFLRDTPQPVCRLGSGAGFPLDPLAPARLDDVSPVPGLPLRAGRALAAVQATLPVLTQDLLWAGLLSFFASSDTEPARTPTTGGLRGGVALMYGHRIALRGYSYVPGVTLTGAGNMRRGAPLTVVVSGAAGARGRLSIGGRWITGRLDGVAVRVRAKTGRFGHLLVSTAAVHVAGAMRAAAAAASRRPLARQFGRPVTVVG